jgi:phosphonopyruvate decarboxylase
MTPIPAESLYDVLAGRGVAFYTGVPDSLLKDFLAYVTRHTPETHHVIAANEGSAVALAAGHYLASGAPALVYMQNSGLGNAVNPLVSLADPAVYGIPMLLLIGWRGEPGRADEPQHLVQGGATPGLLDALGVPYAVLGEDGEGPSLDAVVSRAVDVARERGGPYALLVRKGAFEPYPWQYADEPGLQLTREDAVRALVEVIEPGQPVVATTGQTSRELFEHRVARGQTHDADFLMVGSMGHASQVALAIALATPDRLVYCLDGDGAVLMHLGSLAVIGHRAPRNLRHIVLNNTAHDSVGGQPTASPRADFAAIAIACGYRSATRVGSHDEVVRVATEQKRLEGPTLLEIAVKRGARRDLGRPTRAPAETRQAFMRLLAP